MKLQDVRTAYVEYTGKASDIVRQLGFAGIALIWLFRSDIAGQAKIPQALLLPGLLIVVALTFDLLQYVSGAITWGIFNRRKEHDDWPQEDEFAVHPALNWPTLFFFWGKVALIIAAYVQLGVFVANSLA